jgi:hypothetical protein
MNLAVISGTGWSHHRAAAEALLRRFAAAGGAQTILLDLDTIVREAASDRPAATSIDWPGLVPFDSWVKDHRLAEEAINPQAVLSTARAISTEHLVVVDARHFGMGLVADALLAARIAWFPLDDWHPVFAIVTDDVNALRTLQLLAGTFYCQPQVLTARETTMQVRGVMRRALVQRWLGQSAGRFAGWMERAISRAKLTQEKVSDMLISAPKQ